MTTEPKPPSDGARRRELRRSWETSGKPPCSLCDTPIADDEKSQVSLVFQAVVPWFCASHPIYASVHDAETCPGYAHCTRPAWCRCPRIGVVNAIVWARRSGMATIEVPTAFSPGCERVAKEAGLGTYYTSAPLRESVRYSDLLSHGTIADESLLDSPSSWFEPPETLTVDVNRSIREGRIVACLRPEAQPRQASRDP